MTYRPTAPKPISGRAVGPLASPAAPLPPAPRSAPWWHAHCGHPRPPETLSVLLWGGPHSVPGASPTSHHSGTPAPGSGDLLRASHGTHPGRRAWFPCISSRVTRPPTLLPRGSRTRRAPRQGPGVQPEGRALLHGTAVKRRCAAPPEPEAPGHHPVVPRKGRLVSTWESRQVTTTSRAFPQPPSGPSSTSSPFPRWHKIKQRALRWPVASLPSQPHEVPRCGPTFSVLVWALPQGMSAPGPATGARKCGPVVQVWGPRSGTLCYIRHRGCFPRETRHFPRLAKVSGHRQT